MDMAKQYQKELEWTNVGFFGGSFFVCNVDIWVGGGNNLCFESGLWSSIWS
jgi:hypothetical protein